MWPLYSLLGMFSNALENSFDKVALLEGKKLDYAIMTFYRIAVYVLLITIVGLFGLVGSLHFFVNWKIILMGALGALNSLSYTYVLRKIEVTNIGAIAYIAPIFFLLIDVAWLHMSLSVLQVLGIILLVIGGVGFSIDATTHTLKKELSLVVVGIFVFWLVYGGLESYLFKYMHTTYGLSAPTFFANVWMFSGLCILILIVVQRKVSLLFSQSTHTFIARSVFSKACDTSNTLFTAKALTLASVSQVTAIEALSPLVRLFVAFMLQGVLKISLQERLDKSNVIWKSGMVLLLVAGGFLVR